MTSTMSALQQLCTSLTTAMIALQPSIGSVWAFLLVLAITVTVMHYSYKVYLSWNCKSAPYLRNRLIQYVLSTDVDESKLFTLDQTRSNKVPANIVQQRQAAYKSLKNFFASQSKPTSSASTSLKSALSDGRFGMTACVPFYVRKQVERDFVELTLRVEWTDGVRVSGKKQEDGAVNEKEVAYDITGSFGLNVAGHKQYSAFLESGLRRVQNFGAALGSVNSLMEDNVQRLQQISKQEKVSFHNSGTEAMMAAIRLARFNTNRSYVIVFKGAYHGWWDQVLQASTQAHNGVLTLKELNAHSLSYIEYEGQKIAAVVVNPMQILGLNQFMPVDGMLVDQATRTYGTNETQLANYRTWLHKLRRFCSDLGIALIFDEVYSGFRVAPYGAQELFGVQADLVAYGKSVGGGVPIGVLCGSKTFMCKADPDYIFRRADVMGTFCASPVAMGPMNEFLQWIMQPSTHQLYQQQHTRFHQWAAALSTRLQSANLPVRVSHFHSLISFELLIPSAYHWLLQFYLRRAGLYLPWTGTGRCLLSLDYDEAALKQVADRIFKACEQMKEDGWWYVNNSNKEKSELRSSLMSSVVSSTLTRPLVNFWEEIEMHKRIDDEVAHKHPVNQMFHFISSTLSIVSFVLFGLGLWAWAIVVVLISQSIRQSGHFFFEKSAPGVERAKIGFHTDIKKNLCLTFVTGYTAAALSPTVTKFFMMGNAVPNTADFFVRYLVTYFFFCFMGKAVLVMHKKNVRLGVLWLIKVMTDAFTDLKVYYPSFERVYKMYWHGELPASLLQASQAS